MKGDMVLARKVRPLKKASSLIRQMPLYMDKVRDYFTIENYRNKSTYYIPIALLFLHMATLLFGYLYSLIYIRRVVISNSYLYLALAVLLPIGFWMFSTICDDYAYYGTKKVGLILVVVNGVFTILQPVWTFIYDVVCLRILVHIPVAGTMTPGMLISLDWWMFLLFFGGVSWLCLYCILDVLLNPGVEPFLNRFRLHYVLDFRANRHEAYDVNIMRELTGFGKKMPIYEEDLYTHMALFGPSGTGKTSSALNPMIICFLNRKMENAKKRLAGFEKLLQEGKGYVKAPLDSKAITEYDIVPHKGFEKQFMELRKKYPDCGITVVSPNDSLGDGMQKLCAARNLDVNVVDASKHYKESNMHHKCITPFYIPLDGISDLERAILIVEKSNNFSEVIIRVNEAGRKAGDTYFTDLNTSVTTNIAKLCMIYAYLSNRQTSYLEISECVQDFSYLKPMCDFVKQRLGLDVPVYNPSAKEKVVKDAGSLASAIIHDSGDLDKLYNLQKESQDQQDQLRNGVMDPKTTYFEAIRYVQNELIVNGEKMYDQSRGLRNIIAKMVSDPRVRYVLNGDGSGTDFLDFDRILSRCEITVVNTSIEISQQSSTATGLFFLLNHQNAVQRRKIDDRQPHALIVDESTQYMHSWMENAISLYRQYKCMVCFSFQSSAQMDKTDETRFLKGLMYTIGNIIGYGRLGPEEMRLLEELSGSREIKLEQDTLSQNSILSADPSMTTSVRTTSTEKSYLTGTEIRQRNFQEGTWFPCRQGCVRPGVLIKLSFPDPSEFSDQHIELPDFSDYVLEGMEMENPDSTLQNESGQEKEDTFETILLPEYAEDIQIQMKEYDTFVESVENDFVKTEESPAPLTALLPDGADVESGKAVEGDIFFPTLFGFDGLAQEVAPKRVDTLDGVPADTEDVAFDDIFL